MCPILNTTEIKEHLFSFLSPNENFSVKEFINKFKEIDNNNKKILVGGSGFYLYCLINGLTEKQHISQEIINTINKNSKEENWEQLITLDNSVKDKLHVNDTYRVNNYLSFFLQHGYSMNSIDIRPIINKNEIFNIFIWPPRNDLLKNIENRTNEYFDKMVEESIEFHKIHNFINSKIIGYKTIYDYINKKISKETAINLINLATRQYAKTQVTFLKNKLKADLIINNVYDFNVEEFVEKIYK
jgi:tRNA dimethylallyltransferase